jgi:hypothetical protein
VYARAAVINLKPGCEVELARTFEQEIIPLFRKERDFRGLLAFTFPNGTKALSLSLWDQDDSADGICTKGFGALTALARIALGTLSVQVLEVSNSTFNTTGQIADKRGAIDASSDFRIYQSALRPFKVAAAQRAPA